MNYVILGRGRTLKFWPVAEMYMATHTTTTIGVNDINDHVKFVDHLFCIDHEHRFKDRRLECIKNAKAGSEYGEFHTHLAEEWKDKENRNVFRGKPRQAVTIPDIEKGVIPYGVSSPFVAASFALFRLAHPGDNIIFFGCDYNSDHHFFKTPTGRNKAIADIEWLRDKAAEKKVNMFVGHRASRLIQILKPWKISQ